MKYLSKPPLFSDQSNNSTQERGHIYNYKDYIEAQKTKAIERDQREILDDFIGLLKDYMKEVQKAMQTFKENLDSSTTANTKNTDRIKSVAEKSFTLVDELKEDFKSSFNKLRIDLKENEQLKSLLSKKEEELMKLEMELQLRNKEIQDLKRKEQNALKREEDFKQKEKNFIEKVKEAEMRAVALRDTPPHSQEAIIRHQGVFHSARTHEINQAACHPIQQVPFLSDVYSVENYSTMATHNKLSQLHGVTQTFTQEIRDHEQALPRDTLGNREVYVPAMRDYGSRLQRVEAHPVLSNNHPTASIAPVQKCSTVAQSNGRNPTSLALESSTDVPNVTNTTTLALQTVDSLPSPVDRFTLLDKTKMPKKSPVATVLPQVQVVSSYGEAGKCSIPDGTDHRHDPLRIFNFDLTTSPKCIQPSSNSSHSSIQGVVRDEEKSQCQVEKRKAKPRKKKRSKESVKGPARCYSTRSRTKSASEENGQSSNVSLSKGSTSLVDSVKLKRVASVGFKRKGFSGGSSKSKAICMDNICSAMENWDAASKTKEKRSCSECMEDISKSFEGSVQSLFKRQNSEKRTLDLSGSSLFEIIDEEVSIQQITESIRKHAQKRKIK